MPTNDHDMLPGRTCGQALGCMGMPIPHPADLVTIQFSCVATRNPLEQEGTYSLPEAQLDRFLFDVHVNHPVRGTWLAIADQLHARAEEDDPETTDVPAPRSTGAPVSGSGHPTWFKACSFFRAARVHLFGDSEQSLLGRLKLDHQAAVAGRRPSPSILEACANIAYFSTPGRRQSTGPGAWYADRSSAQLQMELKVIGRRAAQRVRALHARPEFDCVLLGSSIRGFLGLISASMAEAALNGRRDGVTADDVRAVAHDVLRHRILLKPSAWRRGVTPDSIVDLLLQTFFDE
jgi:hypothetical protein